MLKVITPKNWALIKEITDQLVWDGSRCDITPNTVKLTFNRPGPKKKASDGITDEWCTSWQKFWQGIHLILPMLVAEAAEHAAETAQAEADQDVPACEAEQ